MEQKEPTQLESILQRTLDKQSKRIAELSLDLDLAHAQIEIMNDKEEARIEQEKTKEAKQPNAKK